MDSYCLGLVQLLGSVDLCILPNSGCFHPLFLKICFHHFTLSRFRLDSSDINVRPFVIVPRVSEALSILFHLFFLSIV